MRKLFSTLFLFTLLASNAWAQAPAPAAAQAPAASPSLERQFFKNLLRDQKAIWTSPFHLRASDVRWLAPLTITTAGLIVSDRHTGDAIARHPQLLSGSKGISYGGEAYSVAGAALTFYAIGRATHNDRLRETGLLGAEALINSMVVVGVVKGVTQRSRPFEGDDRGRFLTGGTSFPSGHSIQIWSVATVVAHEYGDRRWVQVAAYGTAVAVSLSRFTAQKHYLSDVLVGSALGYGIGRYVFRAHHVAGTAARTEAVSGTRAWTRPFIVPQFDRRAGAYGVTLAWVY